MNTDNQNLKHNRSSIPIEGATAEAKTSPPLAVAVTDSNRIESSFADNPRMMKIIPEFVDGLPDEVRKMMDYLNSNDLVALQRIVHQLRGASGGYGFDAVTDPATRAEESIKVGAASGTITAEINSLIEVIRRIGGYDESKTLVAAGSSPS